MQSVQIHLALLHAVAKMAIVDWHVQVCVIERQNKTKNKTKQNKANEDCTNTAGSFTCSINYGYEHDEGNGLTCTGMCDWKK